MKLKKEFVLMNVMDNDVLVDTTGKYNGVLKLNETSKLLVELLKTDISKQDLIDAIKKEYEVDVKTLENDVDELLKTLKRVKAIDD